MNWPNNHSNNYPREPPVGSGYPAPHQPVGHGGPGRSQPTKKVKPWMIAAGAFCWLVVCGALFSDMDPKGKDDGQAGAEPETAAGFTASGCEAALDHVAVLVGDSNFGDDLRAGCVGADGWAARKAEAYRCAGAAETVAEAQLCGDGELASAVASALEGESKSDLIAAAKDYPGVYTAKGDYVAKQCSDFEVRVAGVIKDELFRDDAVPEETAMQTASKRVGLGVQVTNDVWGKVALECPDRLGGDRAAEPSPTEEGEDALSVALEVGAGPKGKDHIEAISKAYNVTPRTVADKAARTAGLCLGGMDKIREDPTRAVAKLKGSLEFAAGVAHDKVAAKRVGIDELFASYVATGCPDPR